MKFIWGLFQTFFSETPLTSLFWVSEELPALSQLGGTCRAGCGAADTAAGSRLTHGTAACRHFSPTHPFVLMNAVTPKSCVLGHPTSGTSRGCKYCLICWAVYSYGTWAELYRDFPCYRETLQGFGVSCL